MARAGGLQKSAGVPPTHRLRFLSCHVRRVALDRFPYPTIPRSPLANPTGAIYESWTIIVLATLSVFFLK